MRAELGRYNQTTRDKRNCPFCGFSQIEDEIHFLFNCSTFSLIGNNFCNKTKFLIPNITHAMQLLVNVFINELMNTSNYYINLEFQLAWTYATNY